MLRTCSPELAHCLQKDQLVDYLYNFTLLELHSLVLIAFPLELKRLSGFTIPQSTLHNCYCMLTEFLLLLHTFFATCFHNLSKSFPTLSFSRLFCILAADIPIACFLCRLARHSSRVFLLDHLIFSYF